MTESTDLSHINYCLHGNHLRRTQLAANSKESPEIANLGWQSNDRCEIKYRYRCGETDFIGQTAGLTDLKRIDK